VTVSLGIYSPRSGTVTSPKLLFATSSSIPRKKSKG
jgi:hypothetical protein